MSINEERLKGELSVAGHELATRRVAEMQRTTPKCTSPSQGTKIPLLRATHEELRVLAPPLPYGTEEQIGNSPMRDLSVRFVKD